MDIADKSVLIAGNPQGILGQPLRPNPIHVLNKILLYLLLIKLYIIIFVTY